MDAIIERIKPNQVEKVVQSVNIGKEIKEMPKLEKKVFKGKKIWMRKGVQNKDQFDVDLNEAIDRIEQLEQELENMDKELQVYMGESNRLTKENKQLQDEL